MALLLQHIFAANSHNLELINALAQSYAEKITSPVDGLLREVNESTHATHSHAHMLSGHVQGKFLELLSRLVQPRRILEIGTFTGYSALCLAKGLLKDGLLHTIDVSERTRPRPGQISIGQMKAER